MLDEESKKARKSAIRYLVYRDRSRSEIVQYLKEKGFSGNSTDETIAFLEDNDYINDPRFAMQFGRSRIKNKKVGKLRLERELRDKGLKTSIIDLTLGSLYEEHNERELAMACAKKKFDSFSSSDIEKQRGRLARFLDRKGFHTSLVYQVVTQLVPHVTSNDFDPSPQLTKNQHHKTMTSCDQD
jgi:regulatory protein